MIKNIIAKPFSLNIKALIFAILFIFAISIGLIMLYVIKKQLPFIMPILLIWISLAISIILVVNIKTYQFIMDNIPCNIYCKDENGAYTWSNKKNLVSFNLKSLRDILYKTDKDILSAGDYNSIKLIDDKVLKNGSTMFVEEEVSSTQGENIYLSHKVPLKNSRNKIIGVLGISLDITNKYKETIQKLDMLENIIAMMPGNVYWLDRNGVYLGCNDNQARVIGLKSRKDIVGKRNIDIPGFLIPEVLDKCNQQVIETGIAVETEEPAILPNGEDAIFLSNKVPLFADNKVIGMVGISFDVSARKKAEMALIDAKERSEQLNYLKDEFIQNMQHDIRTPISGITLLLSRIKKAKNMSSFMKHISIAYDSSKELLNICNKIIELDQKNYRIDKTFSKGFSLNGLCERIINLNMAAACVNNTKLELNSNKNIPDFINGHNYIIEKVLMNLIGNAIKFTKDGYVLLSVDLIRITDNKCEIEFSVIDNGIGIDEANIDKIFEKFYQVNNANGIFKGSGLGLTSVKRMLNEIGSDIAVNSRYGYGSKFSFIAYLFL